MKPERRYYHVTRWAGPGVIREIPVTYSHEDVEKLVKVARKIAGIHPESSVLAEALKPFETPENTTDGN